MLTNSDNKKVRYTMDFYILHTILVVIILLLIIAIICYHYTKHNSKLKKSYCSANNIKMENGEFLKVCSKNLTCYYFDDIIKFEDFDFDNKLTDEKSNENILIY